jgi:hypothetical protein
MIVKLWDRSAQRRFSFGCVTPGGLAKCVASPSTFLASLRRGITMNDRRRRLLRKGRIVFWVLAAVVPLAGCDRDTPTAPERAATVGATPTVTPLPTATPTPLPGPLAVVEFTLAPARSAYRHAFIVRIDVREARGIPIFVTPTGVWSRGGGYTFPERESGFQVFRVEAFESVTFDMLVEHNEDIPCSAGLFAGVNIESADGLRARFEKEFNCATGYWPL